LISRLPPSKVMLGGGAAAKTVLVGDELDPASEEGSAVINRRGKVPKGAKGRNRELGDRTSNEWIAETVAGVCHSSQLLINLLRVGNYPIQSLFFGSEAIDTTLVGLRDILPPRANPFQPGPGRAALSVLLQFLPC